MTARPDERPNIVWLEKPPQKGLLGIYLFSGQSKRLVAFGRLGHKAPVGAKLPAASIRRPLQQPDRRGFLGAGSRLRRRRMWLASNGRRSVWPGSKRAPGGSTCSKVRPELVEQSTTGPIAGPSGVHIAPGPSRVAAASKLSAASAASRPNAVASGPSGVPVVSRPKSRVPFGPGRVPVASRSSAVAITFEQCGLSDAYGPNGSDVCSKPRIVPMPSGQCRIPVVSEATNSSKTPSGTKRKEVHNGVKPRSKAQGRSDQLKATAKPTSQGSPTDAKTFGLSEFKRCWPDIRTQLQRCYPNVFMKLQSGTESDPHISPPVSGKTPMNANTTTTSVDQGKLQDKELDRDKMQVKTVVVDMRTVLEVVSVLEDFAVTKETLGQTRVGKYVNDMRRKTNDKDLSRRAKNLVRRWKQMVDAAGAVNGEGIAARPAGGQPQPIPPHIAQSVGSRPSSPASRPATPSSGKSTQSPSLPSRSRPDTPSASSRPNTPSSGHVHSPTLPLTRPGTPGTTESPLARGHQDLTPTQPVSRYNHQGPNRGNQGPTATSTPIQPTGTPSGTAESLSKTNATNKKRRRDSDSVNNLSSKKLLLTSDNAEGTVTTSLKTPRNGIVPGVHARAAMPRPESPLTTCDKVVTTPAGAGASRIQRTGNQTSVPSPGERVVAEKGAGDQGLALVTPSRSASLAVKAEADRPRDRTPVVRKAKVKTTAELIQDMKARGNLNLSSTEVSNRIARNQIEKEEDPQNVSIVPAGARPRPRRKPGTVVPPSISEKTLRETKTEMVQKFLQNSFDPLDSDQYERTTPSPLKMDQHRTASPAFLGSANFCNNGSANTSSESNDVHVDVETHFFTDDNKMRRGDQLAGPVIEDKDDDPWSSLPPLLPEGEIDWTEEVYEPPDRTVTEEDVDRLHSQHWGGVNGNYDNNNEWVDWTKPYSGTSFGGDQLPILPYVDIGD